MPTLDSQAVLPEDQLSVIPPMPLSGSGSSRTPSPSQADVPEAETASKAAQPVTQPPPTGVKPLPARSLFPDPPESQDPRDPANRRDPDRAKDGSPPIDPPVSGEASQNELFETDPPPWELTAEDDVLLASIVFSRSPHGPYDYRIPDQLRGEIAPGMRVGVPLGHRKKPTPGWCVGVKEGKAIHRKLRDVAETLDDAPL